MSLLHIQLIPLVRRGCSVYPQLKGLNFDFNWPFPVRSGRNGAYVSMAPQEYATQIK